MNLSFLESDMYNTLLVQSNGAPLYHIKTPPSGHPHTVITKIVASNGYGFGFDSDESKDKEMAHIEVHRWHSSTVDVWGKSFVPSRTHLLSSSEAFTGSNGKRYLWRRGAREQIELTSMEDKTFPVATYEPELPATVSSTSKSASLQIKFEGLAILDELVTTFVYIQQKHHKREVAEHEKLMLDIDPTRSRPNSSHSDRPSLGSRHSTRSMHSLRSACSRRSHSSQPKG
ncbi:hypothetical protein GYMLUDRAFT_51383 [Collybiopsis luxurians FD-317 M1]|uniref:DUF6593 domain-containing protein n=1 Tax=Collybiopsis luxurians FD-317 M1 TaxID=944289 RepID=A0A0D0AIX2_9AGAR|nr:hypothetical protein GYMLUDRAFT_51383 [Collybiopsis luxurians FD-317 M1]